MDNEDKYVIIYEMGCWPKSATQEEKKFTSKEAAMEWLYEMNDWACLEGNTFTVWHGYNLAEDPNKAINPSKDYFHWKESQPQ